MEFITDRTYADVLKLKEYKKRGWKNMDKDEQQEWLQDLKGSFNLSDLKRITNNIDELGDLLSGKFRKKINMVYADGIFKATIPEDYTYIYVNADNTKFIWTYERYNADGTLSSTGNRSGSLGFSKDATQIAYIIVTSTSYINNINVYATDFVINTYVPSSIDYNDNTIIPKQSILQNRFDRQNLLLSYIPEYGKDYKVDLKKVYKELDFEYLNSIESKLELLYNFINTPFNQYNVPVEWNYEDTVSVLNEDDVTENHITTDDYIWFNNIGKPTTYLYAPAGTVAHIVWYDEITLKEFNSYRMEWTSTDWKGIVASGLFKVTFYAQNGVDLENNVKVQQRYRLY